MHSFGYQLIMRSQMVSDTAARVVTAPTTLNQGLHLLKVSVLAFFAGSYK